MLTRIKDTLLIVGDVNSSRSDLCGIFHESFNILEAESISQAIMLLEYNFSCIALVMTDIPVQNVDDIDHLMQATKKGTDHEIPVVAFIHSSEGTEREERAFLLGAADVILKPYSPLAVQKRVQVLIEMFVHKWNLEKLVREQSEKIRNTNQVMMDTLSAIIEYRSTESGNHVLRIRRFTKILLEEVARCCPEYELTDELIDVIASASALHDIGKISIPDAILNKPGRLTPEEFEVMKTHTTVGGELVQQLAGMGEELYLRYAYNISLYHHERWGGLGYPCGLKEDEIPICAQVVGLADAFDALTTKRIYKPAYPYQNAINMILNGECGEFSPKVLECFKHVRQDFVELAHFYSDGHSPKADQISAPLPGPVWKNSLNSLQLSQAKYLALLHYINDTILELDLDNELYHVVYNPNPDFDSIVPNASFDKIVDILRVSELYPGDEQVVDEMERFIMEDFFESNLRRKSFFLRIFSKVIGTYQAYELIFLKIHTGGSGQRIVTAIWHKIDDQKEQIQKTNEEPLISAPALKGLASSILRCKSDCQLTIEAGVENLCPLVEYTEQEIDTLFQCQLMNLVLLEDRPVLENMIKETILTGAKVEGEFRLLCKNADPVWTLAKMRLYAEEDGSESLYFAIRDNRQSREEKIQLLTDIERNQILIDQTGSIVFDWDLINDTMYCSPKWEEHFGYIPVSKNYGKQMGLATHFHPDDLIHVRDCVGKICEGVDSVVIDVRIANAAGKYLWTKITATGRKDARGNVNRIIGILQDIDDLKRAALILQEKAEKDALTKLLNKASTQNQVSAYLLERQEDELAGILVLDLDNFKSVNDTLGHMYGDVVLTQVGTTLRKFFRSQDIIGRIGGDEFMILMKDIPSRQLLKDRCELLVNTLRKMLSELMPDLQVSCSIGAVMVPNHGVTYGELFQKADEALYHAKNKGKNQYKIYNAKDKYTLTMDAGSRITRIDSDDPGTVTSDSFERFVFRCLYESTDLDGTINELLGFVGSNFNVSRAYIFENNEDNTACSNTYEWCNVGIQPQIEELQNVSYITDIPGWTEVYDENGIFYCTDITQLAPQFRAILDPQEIKSMLQCAIMDHGVFRGYVGFDECVNNRLWTQEQLSKLEFLAQALAVFLIRKRSREEK